MTDKSTWDDPRITAYVLGELSGHELVAFETEIQSNQALASAVDEARGVTGLLEGLYAAESTPPLDDSRRDAISVTQNPPVVPPPSHPFSWKVPMLVLTSAAVLMLLIGVSPMLKRASETTVTQVPVADGNSAAAKPAARDLAEAELDDPSRDFSDADATRPSIVTRSSIVLEPPTRDEKLKQQGASLHEQMEDSASNVFGNAPSPMGSSRPSEPASKERLLSGDKSTELQTDEVAGGKSDFRGHRSMRQRRQNDSLKKDLQDQQEARRKDSASLQSHSSMSAAAIAAPAPISGPKPSTENERNRFNSHQQFAPAFAAEGAIKSMPKSEAILGLEKAQGNKGESFGLSPSSFAEPDPLGRGPGIAGDRFEPITDNAFKRVDEHPLSTFSVDVDTASYSKTRDFLMRANQLPRPDAVRIEELVNYFNYDYEPPADDAEHPFAARVSITSCPWNEEHRLARIALKGKSMEKDERPPCNLVFLLDTSGSMNAPNKLPLVIDGMKMLVEQLSEKDRVAITVYAGSAGLVLDSTSAKKSKKIRKALTQLAAGGSTNGGAGIALAYQTARDNFISNGVNRVILCTDGDFNVGTTGTDSLVRLVEREAQGGIFLSVLGFGMGNHNDAMLEQISGRGNGNYAFIDTKQEAHKVLVEQASSTLVTIAKDVKLQIEFNPTRVSSYRLIGYENRVLAKEDFNDDKKDAGEIGAGHAVTALYELVPAGVEADASRPKVDELKYQSKLGTTEASTSDETMTLKLRYKQPDGDTSTLVEFPVTDDGGKFDQADTETRFAAAVAGFGMQLRRSEYAGNWTMSDVQRIAQSAKGDDKHGLRHEFVEMVRKATELMGLE